MNNRFGAGFVGEADIGRIVIDAQLAEAMGFGSVWIAEDYFFGGGFSIATACTSSTKNIHIGIGVLNPYTRHPSLIAMEAAALSKLSGGRFLVGLGASNALWIEKQMGIPFTKALSSLRDTIKIMRGMFQGQPFSYDGDMFHVSNILLKVPDCGDIPIILGVKSEQMLKMAAENADGVLLSVGCSINYIQWVKQQLEAGAQACKRDLRDFSIYAYLLISMDENRQLARERCRERVAYFLGLHGDHAIMRAAGYSAETVAPFREGFLQRKNPSDLVTEEMIDTLAIAGTVDECRAKIQQYLDAGVTHPILFDFGHVPMAENMRLAKENLFDLMK